MKKLYKVKKHGEVVDAFIPARKSKKGYRFGFVRFTTLKEAEKAIAQMNGCVLYGSRLVVRLAKFSDNLEDRLCKQLKFRVLKNGESSKNQSKYIGDMSNSPRDSLKKSSNSQRLTEENRPIGRVNCLKASWAGIVSKNVGCQGDKAEEDISHKLFRNAEMGFDLGRAKETSVLENIVGFKLFGTEPEVVREEEVLDTSNLQNWPTLGA
ncbi:hypothetical protein V6N11_010984 [Hibiscus sabdariffa]|uniref:RRM domain-containing protein n=1 Tax=Hibiscus sabdariffa TaxID=183260 RepID=A0ABR2S6Y0_9ROSI